MTVWSGILVALMIATQACTAANGDGQLPAVDCATAVPGFAEVTAFGACTSCHASTLQGASRAGAPSGVDFDTHDDAVTSAERAVVRVYAGTMPPLGSLADQRKADLYAWALCGTPP